MGGFIFISANMGSARPSPAPTTRRNFWKLIGRCVINLRCKSKSAQRELFAAA
jgi:hypothetical protein